MLQSKSLKTLTFLAILCAISLLLAACDTIQTPPLQGKTLTKTDEISTRLTPTPALSSPTAAAPNPSPTPQIPTATTATCEDATRKIVSDQLESAQAEEELPFLMYLPPCYGQNPAQRYPVIYLLHGLYADETLFSDLGLLSAADHLENSGESSPFLVVMPRIPDISNYPDSTNARFMVEELLPYVDAHYQTRAERFSRAIGGVSRGATWALRIGLSEWQYFGKIGLHSLAMDYSEVKSWVNVLAELEQEDRPELFMDVGNLDEDQDSAQSLDFELNNAGLPHSYHLFIGAHNEDYWRNHLPTYLEWYTQDW